MNGIELQTQREVWLKARAALMERESEAEASRIRHQGEIDRAKTRMDSEFEKLQKMVGEVSTTANDYLRPPGQDESLKAADEIARQSPKAVRRVGLADENVFGEAEDGPSADPNAKTAFDAEPNPSTDPSFGGPVGNRDTVSILAASGHYIDLINSQAICWRGDPLMLESASGSKFDAEPNPSTDPSFGGPVGNRDSVSFRPRGFA